MKKFIILAFLVGCIVIVQTEGKDAVRKNGFCSWVTYRNSSCPLLDFLCTNGKCINRKQYCDGRNDCGDNSDENYCYENYNCQNKVGRMRCPDATKCIPEEWFCDGIMDCPNGRDEQACDQYKRKAIAVKVKALEWLNGQKKNESVTDTWGYYAYRTAVALYLSGNSSKNVTKERKELAYEVSIQLLSRLAKSELQDIPSTDLALYLNALLVTCVDPRKFHGLDIVEELRTRVDRQNYTNPFILVALCNAGVTITKSDRDKLMVAWDRRDMEFWTDIQAGILMALACASRQPGNDVDSEKLTELAAELKQHQYRNGTVENLQTTALVLQALLAAEPESDPDNFDDTKALQQVIAMQKADGSFGSFMNTYYVLPVLNCMSLVNISSDHCESSQKDEMSGLDDLINRAGPKVRVQYSIWIGNDKDLERNIALRVPANMSFYGVMEMAANIDSRYRFEYVVKNRKPYVNALSGLQNDPERGKFWFLYTIGDGKPIPSQQMPADMKVKENDHFVMWYKSGSWVD